MSAPTITPTFETRRTRTGQVVAVGAVRDLEAARHAGMRVVLIDPSGRTATARVAALGRTFLPRGVGAPQAYGYVVDLHIEEDGL